MAKRLNYEVGFSPNTGELLQALNKAVESLLKLGTSSLNRLTSELKQASNAALELSMNLQKAYNQETGKLDLVSFNNSLKQSGLTISQYADLLKKLGPEGEKAFLNVASAVGKAELPLLRSNRLLSELWTTMKNTARWQLTSSALHGFIGAVQTAYGYTKDLNESLNNIRIVTGLSVEQMAEFAKLANEAAKTLSTTTTDYTNAALIYYQLGLSDEEVEGRTNVTIKLANAAGESAETASELLTAIWNNFYDGSKSLEYYADVMTALGASTASSTEEISAGLQKFAAIADTVGLSYEYAASALATITATTRESADTVGTALRTLFARLQGLIQDGEADDGTTLNKYSKALAEVGIQIKDTDGELRSMNDILDDLGERWGTLTKAQLMALAQTVAGVRQYAQLIALMDNWSFFQENLTTAMGSEGTLQKQADIYAESWEAARDRVRAASEDIYDSIINEDFFIGVDKTMTPVLSGIATMIDALGGMQGVAIAAATALMALYGDKMAAGLRTIATNVGIITGLEGLRARQTLAEFAQESLNLTITAAASEALVIKNNLMQEEIKLLGIINENSGRYSEEQLNQISREQELLNILRQSAEAHADRALQLEGRRNDASADIMIQAVLADHNWDNIKALIDTFSKNNPVQLSAELKAQDTEAMVRKLTGYLGELGTKASNITALNNASTTLGAVTDKNVDTFNRLVVALGGLNTKDVEKLQAEVDRLGAEASDTNTKISETSRVLKTLGADDKSILQYLSAVILLNLELAAGRLTEDDFKKQLEDLSSRVMRGAILSTLDWATALVAVGRELGVLAMYTNSIRSLFRVFTDEDMDAGERFVTILTSLSMLIPAVTLTYTAWKGVVELVRGAIEKSAKSKLEDAAATELHRKEADKDSVSTANNAASFKKNTVEVDKNTGSILLNIGAHKALRNGAQTTVPMLTAGGKAAGGFSLSLGAAAVAAGVLTAALLAGVAAFVIYNQVLKLLNEALGENADRVLEHAAALEEERKAHGDLISDMESALAIYQETGDNKSELDDACVALALAYNLEGSALAELSGKYEDYNSLLQKARDARREELEASLKENEEIALAYANKLQSLAYDLGNSFMGWNNIFTNDEESKAVGILSSNIDSRFLTGGYTVDTRTMPGSAPLPVGYSKFGFDVDYNSLDDVLEFYNQLDEAIKLMEDPNSGLTATERAQSGVYQLAVKYRDNLKETVEAYQEYADGVLSTQAALGQLEGLGNAPSLFDVDSLEEYEEWVDSVTEALGDEYTEVEKQVIIGKAVSDSNNSQIVSYAKLHDAIEEAADLSGIDQDFLSKIFNDEAYDRTILASLDWANITEDNFQLAYDQAEKYQGALTRVQEATEQLAGVQSALSAVSGGLTEKEISELSEGIDWGNAEKGIISFTEFLQKSADEQEQYLRELLDTTYVELITGYKDTIEQATIGAQQALEKLNQITPERLEAANLEVDSWRNAQLAYNDYQNALENGKEAEFNIGDYDIGDVNWDYLSSIESQELANLIISNLIDYYQLLGDEYNRASAELENYNLLIEETNNKQASAEYAFAHSFESLSKLRLAYEDGKFSALAFNIAAQDLHDASRMEGLEAEDVLNYAEYLQDLCDDVDDAGNSVNDLSDDLLNNEDAAKDVAIQIKRMNLGVDNLADNWDDWSDILKNSSKDSAEYFDAMEGVRDAMSDVLDIDKEFVSSDFVADHLDDIALAALGDADAIDRLRAAALDDIVVKIAQLNDLNPEDLANQVAGLLTMLEEMGPLEVGSVIGDVLGEQGFIDALNQMILDAGMTTDLVNAMLSGMGFEANFAQEPQEVTTTIPEYTTYHEPAQTGTVTLNAGTPDERTADVWTETSWTEQTGEHVATTTANAFAMLASEPGTTVVPKISSITRKAPGSYNNYSSRNKGGGSPGKSSKSGGSGSTKQPKSEKTLEKKTQEDIDDRYHEIERAIKDQADALDDVNEAANRAYGTKRLDLFKKNLQALTKQADNYLAKMKLASHFIDIDKKALLDILPNISFGDNGEILRYQDLLDSILDEYNAFIDLYNAFIATYNAASAALQEAMESELEAWKTAKDDLDELFDKKTEALKQYEESLDEWQQARDDWEDTLRQIEDLKLEEITYKMEVVLEIKNAEDVLTEFKKDLAESFGDALNNQYYGPEGPGRGTGAFGRELVEREMELLPHYEEEYAELLQRLSEANEFTDVDAIKDALLEVGENAIDSASKLLEWVNSIEEMVPDAIDAARERFEKFTSQLEHNSAMTDSIKELYELQGVTYKTQLGFDRLQKADLARLNTAVALATLNRQWNQEAKEELDRARADFDGLMAKYNGDLTQALLDVSFDTYKNNLDAALLEFNESEEAMYESAAEAMLAAQDMYLRGVEKTVYDFGQAVSGGIGLDFLQEKFDHYIDQEERYLDKVNEAYLVSSWYTKLLNDIDKTTNSAMAKRLKALLDEIDMRRENNTLSQYDLDILEAKYQVLQAQMALEDAQNAKNELRLVRDNLGNWNYQYTASLDEIANKQLELLEAENDWYNIAKQLVKDVTSEIVDTWKECQDAILALYEDPSLLERPEELNAKKAEIEEYYSKKIQDLWAEHLIAVLDMTEAGNKDLFDMAVLMGDKVSDLTGLTSEEIKGIIDQYGGDIVGLLLSDYEDIQNILGDSRDEIDLFSNTFGADLTDMTTNAQNFEKDLLTALDNADKYFDTYNGTVHRVASETGTDLDTLDAKTDELATSTDTLREAAEELIPVWWDMIGHVHDLTDEYLDLADAVMEAIRRMQELAEQSTLTVRAASGIDDIGTVGTNTNNVDFSTLMAEYIAGGGSYNDDTYLALYAMREQKINSLEQLGVSSDYWKARGADTQGLIEGLIASGTDYMSDEELAEWLKRLGIIDSRIAGYATGGYTGDFEDGKLAFLHEKELVLNQLDTENILAAVQTIRALTPELLRTIEAIMDNNASLNMSLVGRRIIGNTPVDGGIVELNVHIEASFPNVTNSREIEQAFTNLINDASQWARKRTE